MLRDQVGRTNTYRLFRHVPEQGFAGSKKVAVRWLAPMHMTEKKATRLIRPAAMRTRSNCAATVHALNYFAVHALSLRPLIRLHRISTEEVGTRKSGHG